MKKQLFFLFLGLFLINSVLALDCQYTETENYEIFEEGLYNLNGDYRGTPLEFEDFSGGSMNIQGCNPPSFKVYNPTDKNLILNISYQTSWNTAFGARSANHQTTISINKYSFSDKLQGSCPDLGSGSISQESIKYTIFEPEEIILKNEKVTKQRDVCKLCGNEICLNDGASCNPLYDDPKCGSGFCNIAGFCGSQKVIDCQEGYFNCNNKQCLKSDSVDFPNNTEVGCEEACVYGGEKGVCFENPLLVKKRENTTKRNWIIFGVIVLIIGLVLVAKLALFPYIKRRKEEEKGRDEAKNQRENEEEMRDKAKQEYEEFVKKNKKINQEISDLESEFASQKVKKESTLKEIDKKLKQKEILFQERIDDLNKNYETEKNSIEEEISRLKEGRKNAKTEAKRKIDKELRKYDEKLIKAREETSKEIEKQRLAKKEAEKERRRYQEEMNEIEMTKPEREIELLENEYKKEYETGARKIKFDKPKQRFFITSLYGQDEPLSRYVYEKRCLKNKKIGNKQIHHINRNQKIDRPENLIALSKDDHDKILEENIIKDDWRSGIKEIKRALEWEDSDFPEHIQKEIKKKEEILNRIARRSHGKSPRRKR